MVKQSYIVGTIFCYFVMKSFKYAAKLKQMYSEYLYTLHLDSKINMLLCLLCHESIHPTVIHPTVLFL